MRLRRHLQLQPHLSRRVRRKSAHLSLYGLGMNLLFLSVSCPGSTQDVVLGSATNLLFLYQGTTLVVPPPRPKSPGFSPCHRKIPTNFQWKKRRG